MELYQNYKKLEYFLKTSNNIFDIKYIGFEYLDESFYPSYFVFDCKYEYYHYKLKYYCNDEIVEEYLNIHIKIILYLDGNNYYIKFSDLFSCFNDNLILLLCTNDYKRLKNYELYDDINDLAKYIRINYGLDVRKD